MLARGTILQNRYQILDLLVQGGMGAVYRAQALHLGQVVALKENTGGDPHQFQQEAVLLANLRHPNLPRVIDHFVEANGAQYLVMDFVEGADLETRLERQGALPEAQVLAWFDQILDAVAYLHSRGVIHRDIKPANIKITPAGQAVLVDFGIAKVYQPGRMTMSGARAATSGYAAPEQYRGGTDQRTDIYALGASLYALFTGSAPGDAQALERRTVSLTVPRTLNPALSAQTEQVILRAMALPPNERFQSAGEMRAALAKPLQSTMPVPQPLPSAPQTAPNPIARVIAALPGLRRNNALILGLGAVVGLLVLLGAGGVVLMVRSAATTPTTAALATKTLTVTATRIIPTDTAIPPTVTATLTFSVSPTSVPTLTATALLATSTSKPTAQPRPATNTPARIATQRPSPPVSCVYPWPSNTPLPTPESSQNNPVVTIAGHVEYTDGIPAASATVETDKGGSITTDAKGGFSFQVHSRRGVRLAITVPEGKYTFVVDAITNISVNLCIPR